MTGQLLVASCSIATLKNIFWPTHLTGIQVLHTPTWLMSFSNKNNNFDASKSTLCPVGTEKSGTFTRGQILTFTFLGHHHMFRCVSLHNGGIKAMPAKSWHNYFDISIDSKVTGEIPFLPKTVILTFRDLQSLPCWSLINSGYMLAKDPQELLIALSAASYHNSS